MKTEKSKLKSINSDSGMSLIEVVITMFLLSVLLVFYVAALNTVAISRKQRYEDIAYHVANTQMEILRNTPFASLPPSNTFSDSQLSLIPSGAANYTISDYSGFTGMKEIVVTVAWNDGTSKQVDLKTLAGSG
ncbi:MAG TPA: prepilin-type N-terminal cleavage/methylation domain-containing protein, partial [Methylomirabilota bacterium]|nr:prepilin-type N-terminal cleavage/methylation domain-containing protein [Methylomirabilota bacterium]